MFAGEDGIIYAIAPGGELLWHRNLDPDHGHVIGHGWHGIRAACAGGDGIIYATTEAGDLLWGRDEHRDGTGTAEGPSAVGHGGWDVMLWLISGA